MKPFLGTYRETPDGIEPCDVISFALAADGPNGRRVAYTQFEGGAFISTVFLSIDHSFSAQEAPILYESLLSDIPDYADDSLMRYHTREEATAGHILLVEEAMSKGLRVINGADELLLQENN